MEDPFELDDFITDGVNIGGGSFGTVQRVAHRRSGEVYAMKLVPRAKITENRMEEYLRREVETQMRLDHPSILRLYHCFEDEESYRLLLEYADGGSLFGMLRRRGRLSSERAAPIFAGIASALDHLHQMGLIHRDVKPENILMCGDEAKLADFGWCAEFSAGGDKRQTFCGTLDYLPPEMIKNDPHDCTVDNWAMGVLLYEMLLGRAPFAEGGKTNLHRILEATVNKWEDGAIPPQAEELMMSLLQTEPSERISLSAAVDHSWVVENGGAPPRPPQKSSSAPSGGDSAGAVQAASTPEPLVEAPASSVESDAALLAAQAEEELRLLAGGGGFQAQKSSSESDAALAAAEAEEELRRLFGDGALQAAAPYAKGVEAIDPSPEASPRGPDDQPRQTEDKRILLSNEEAQADDAPPRRSEMPRRSEALPRRSVSFALDVSVVRPPLSSDSCASASQPNSTAELQARARAATACEDAEAMAAQAEEELRQLMAGSSPTQAAEAFSPPWGESSIRPAGTTGSPGSPSSTGALDVTIARAASLEDSLRCAAAAAAAVAEAEEQMRLLSVEPLSPPPAAPSQPNADAPAKPAETQQPSAAPPSAAAASPFAAPPPPSAEDSAAAAAARAAALEAAEEGLRRFREMEATSGSTCKEVAPEDGLSRSRVWGETSVYKKVEEWKSQNGNPNRTVSPCPQRSRVWGETSMYKALAEWTKQEVPTRRGPGGGLDMTVQFPPRGPAEPPPDNLSRTAPAVASRASGASPATPASAAKGAAPRDLSPIRPDRVCSGQPPADRCVLDIPVLSLEQSQAGLPQLESTLERGQLAGLLETSMHSMPRLESRAQKLAERDPEYASVLAAERVEAASKSHMLSMDRGSGPFCGGAPLSSAAPDHGPLRPVVLSVEPAGNGVQAVWEPASARTADKLAGMARLSAQLGDTIRAGVGGGQNAL